MVIAIFGLIFAVVGGIGVRRNRVMTRTGQRVTGTVTGVQRKRSSDGDGGSSYVYRAELEFQTVDGQPVRTVTGNGGSRIIAQPGEQVPVIYDPRRPTRAEINTRAGRVTWLPFVFVVIGLGLVAYGVYHLVSGKG